MKLYKAIGTLRPSSQTETSKEEWNGRDGDLYGTTTVKIITQYYDADVILYSLRAEWTYVGPGESRLFEKDEIGRSTFPINFSRQWEKDGGNSAKATGNIYINFNFALKEGKLIPFDFRRENKLVWTNIDGFSKEDARIVSQSIIEFFINN
jgi:hypothetical protein